jgi:hypothetical protein
MTPRRLNEERHISHTDGPSMEPSGINRWQPAANSARAAEFRPVSLDQLESVEGEVTVEVIG